MGADSGPGWHEDRRAVQKRHRPHSAGCILPTAVLFLPAIVFFLPAAALFIYMAAPPCPILPVESVLFATLYQRKTYFSIAEALEIIPFEIVPLEIVPSPCYP